MRQSRTTWTRSSAAFTPSSSAVIKTAAAAPSGTPLPILGATRSPAEAWAAFVAQRDGLTARMELSTCNGCDGCGLRCMDGFTVTRAERDAVHAYLSTQPEAEVRRVLGQNKTVPWPGGEEFGATVTYCRYRDMERGNCFVYPARPTVCRLFGHTDWLPCPTGDVRSIPSGGGEVWNAYRMFEHRTWDAWDTREESVAQAVSDVEKSPGASEKTTA